MALTLSEWKDIRNKGICKRDLHKTISGGKQKKFVNEQT